MERYQIYLYVFDRRRLVGKWSQNICNVRGLVKLP
jgi:hypothetical protein